MKDRIKQQHKNVWTGIEPATYTAPTALPSQFNEIETPTLQLQFI